MCRSLSAAYPERPHALRKVARSAAAAAGWGPPICVLPIEKNRIASVFSLIFIKYKATLQMNSSIILRNRRIPSEKVCSSFKAQG